MPCRIQRATKRLKLISLPTLESSLDSDEMLLEYVLGQTQSYCLRITRGAASVMVLPNGRKRIEDVVDNYLSAIKSRQSEIGPAENLFSMLLSPVIGSEPQTKLIVVPDGKLNLLPFDALRDLEGRYVLESHTVHQHLADGADEGAALRQAKLDLLQEFADQALPLYWAGFTLVGDGSTAIFK
jgi:CHAT domain-containing protein